MGPDGEDGTEDDIVSWSQDSDEKGSGEKSSGAKPSTAPPKPPPNSRAGRLGAWKNLQQQAWELVDNKKSFQDFIRGEIQGALK